MKLFSVIFLLVFIAICFTSIEGSKCKCARKGPKIRFSDIQKLEEKPKYPYCKERMIMKRMLWLDSTGMFLWIEGFPHLDYDFLVCQLPLQSKMHAKMLPLGTGDPMNSIWWAYWGAAGVGEETSCSMGANPSILCFIMTKSFCVNWF